MSQQKNLHFAILTNIVCVYLPTWVSNTLEQNSEFDIANDATISTVTIRKTKRIGHETTMDQKLNIPVAECDTLISALYKGVFNLFSFKKILLWQFLKVKHLIYNSWLFELELKTAYQKSWFNLIYQFAVVSNITEADVCSWFIAHWQYADISYMSTIILEKCIYFIIIIIFLTSSNLWI